MKAETNRRWTQMKANLDPQITQITQVSVLATDEAWSELEPCHQQ
jgi:hypothetical protein